MLWSTGSKVPLALQNAEPVSQGEVFQMEGGSGFECRGRCGTQHPERTDAFRSYSYLTQQMPLRSYFRRRNSLLSKTAFTSAVLDREFTPATGRHGVQLA